ncbi:MAG: hypothetical protein R6W74_01050 [Nitrosomonas halophila]
MRDDLMAAGLKFVGAQVHPWPSPNTLTVCEAPRTEETQPNTNMRREDCLSTDSIE